MNPQEVTVMLSLPLLTEAKTSDYERTKEDPVSFSLIDDGSIIGAVQSFSLIHCL